MLLYSSKENISHSFAIAQKLGFLLTAGTLRERSRVKGKVVIEKTVVLQQESK